MDNEKHPSKLVPEVEPSVILVCDDDADARALASHTLSALGHRIIEAEDGLHAIDLCKKEVPHVAVVDIMMPNMDGHGLLKWFREQSQDSFTPVIFLTALGDIDDRVAGLDGGADDYLSKPFHYRELQARVEALLRIRILTQNLYSRTRELEQTNRELVETQSKLIEKERELVLAQLSGAAAHSLGQPLTAMLLQLHLLERQLQGVLPEGTGSEVSKLVEALKSECKSIKTMIDNLEQLDSTQVEKYVGAIDILRTK